MSRYHFSRAFKQSMGLSPIHYIVQQRIERAKKLLAETALPIADIALRAGFCLSLPTDRPPGPTGLP
jgi:AraC family transcriptional regulator